METITQWEWAEPDLTTGVQEQPLAQSRRPSLMWHECSGENASSVNRRETAELTKPGVQHVQEEVSIPSGNHPAASPLR